MNTFENEKFFVFTPVFFMQNTVDNIRVSLPEIAGNREVIHSLLSWGLKKAFGTMTGMVVDGFYSDPLCERAYEALRYDFESYMLGVITELGNHLFKENLRYNLVLTYERLYVISY